MTHKSAPSQEDVTMATKPASGTERSKKPTEPPIKGTRWAKIKGGPRDGEWIMKPLSMK